MLSMSFIEVVCMNRALHCLPISKRMQVHRKMALVPVRLFCTAVGMHVSGFIFVREQTLKCES